MPNFVSQSLDLGQNSDGDILYFQIFGQSPINGNCHNSRNFDDIDMKLAPITKLDKRNTATLKQYDDDDVSTNYDVIVIFLIYG